METLRDFNRDPLRGYLRGDSVSGRVCPQGVSGLDCWHRFDLGVTTSSGKITSTADLTGLGHVAAQGTDANRPTTATVNGYTVARFGDGTPSNLWLEYSTPWAQALDTTVYAVIRYKSSGGNQIILCSHDIAATPHPNCYASSSAGNLDKPFMTDGVNPAISATTLTDGGIYVLRFGWTYAGASSVLRCSANGDTEATATPSSETRRNWKNIGILEGTLIQDLVSDLFELRFYDHTLDVTEDTRVMSHLLGRYVPSHGIGGAAVVVSATGVAL